MQNISYLFWHYQEYSIHIVYIYSFIHLSISSLIINSLLIILFYPHYESSIVIDALYISFAFEYLLCFNKKIITNVFITNISIFNYDWSEIISSDNYVYVFGAMQTIYLAI